MIFNFDDEFLAYLIHSEALNNNIVFHKDEVILNQWSVHLFNFYFRYKQSCVFLHSSPDLLSVDECTISFYRHRYKEEGKRAILGSLRMALNSVLSYLNLSA